MPVKRIGDYEIIREVGKGAFGKVYLAERITNDNEKEQLAIKVLNDKPNLNEIFREVLNWKVVSHHKNILTFYDAKEIDGEILFISEYIESGSLEDQIQKSIIKNLSFEEKIELILGI